jgi:hypothetical protein
VNQRYLKQQTHKWHIYVKEHEGSSPDRQGNGNQERKDAIDMDIKAVHVAFKILNSNEAIPPDTNIFDATCYLM